MKNLASNLVSNLARNLRAVSLAAVALVSSTAMTNDASACFGGIAVLASAARVVNTTNQTTAVGNLVSLAPRVTLCSGAIEFPTFVAAGGATVQAVGSCYTIKATIVGPTQTRFEIFYSGAPGSGIVLVELGGPNSQVGFDRTAPNPGTAGSFSGRDFQYIVGTGAWCVFANYHTPVQIAGMPIRNDLYAKLFVKFSACFDAGDRLIFDIDTDRLY
jgi:hypothetical protein